jgi:hypothetical protein
MKRLLLPLLICFSFVQALNANDITAGPRDYFEMRVYHFTTKEQETILDEFLKNALLPALHKNNRKLVGVFKPVANDTAIDKRIFVLIPHKSVKDFTELPGKLDKDQTYQTSGTAYINAPYTKPVYTRMEIILLYGFEGMGTLAKPQLNGKKAENIYEMRSYEGHTEKISRNKIDMFNKGDEVGLFKRLNFNSVFYAQVLAGSRMPNLMYMTSFNSMEERDAHWKAFFADPHWKTLSADPKYKNNVSKNEITFLKSVEYSDL